MDKFDPNKTDFLNSDLTSYKTGRNKPYLFGKKYYVVNLSEALPVMSKELSETKGIVTSDYQQYLEKEWLTELSKNHQIKINYDVLYSLGE